MASTYLTRTQSTPTSTRIATFSFWCKRSSTSSYEYIISTKNSGSSRDGIALSSDNDLDVRFNAGASSPIRVQTNRKFRDPAAWYHIVVAIDTTQSTASDRVKLYVNGTQETSLVTSDYPSQNYDFSLNATSSYATIIGKNTTSDANYFNGLLTHFHAIDGTAYTPSSFGETDSTSGIWKPKTNPSVTYGTNGFFLKFANSASLGLDSSGNTNNFTVNGTGTQTKDTPSNNFATMNPLAMGTASSGLTFSNGNLTSTNSSSGHRSVLSTLAVSTGKWYYEGKSVTTGGAYPTFGIFNIDAAFDAGTFFTSTANGYGYNSNGHIYHNNGSLITGLSTWTDGDIIGIALDATNNKLYISKNGSWQNSGDPSNNTGGISITSDITWCFAAHLNDAGTNPVQNYNFGQGFFGTTAVASANADANGFGAMEYAVPTGFYTLCTKNIKEFG